MGKGKRNRQNRITADTELKQFLDKHPECRKAMLAEINRQLAQAHRQFFESELAVILYVLHEVFNIGHDRGMKFIREYKKTAKEVTDFYEEEYESPTSGYFFKRRVKDIMGIDVEQEFEVDRAE